MKMLIRSSLLRSSGIYTAANLLNAAIPFFMLPILTRYLTPTDYGIVAMFTAMIGFFTPVIGINIHGAINRQYFERDQIDLPKYIGNAFLLLFTSFLIVSLFVWLISNPLASLTAFPKEWLFAVLLVSLFQVINQVMLVMWQVKVKPLKYGTFQVLQTSLNVGLTLFFVLILAMGWEGRIQGQLIAICFFGLISLIILRKDGLINFSFNKGYIRHILNFGMPLIPHTLGAVIITMSDRFFVTSMVGVSATGVYTVGYQLGMVIGISQDSFNKAWVPWFFGKLKKNEEKDKVTIIKITYMYFVIILILALVFGFLSPILLPYLLGEEFRSAGQFIIWIALGFAFNGMYKMVTNYIFFLQKTKYLMILTFVTAVINLVLNYFLINEFGAIGAAMATCIAFLIIFIFTWIIASKLYKMPWNIIKLFKK
ncbi:oligosaccharide flippase family protein [Pontibacillus sp. HMF3514]|nr:oligosaccharide flippase family protein [Pontibacillus sp. HMF3514]